MDIASFQHHEHMSIVNGSNAILPCRVSDGGPVRWLHSESDITPQYVMFDGRSVQSNYSDRVRTHVDHTAGDFNLSVSNVQLKDSGWYICIEINSQHVHLHLLKVHGLYGLRQMFRTRFSYIPWKTSTGRKVTHSNVFNVLHQE